MHSPFDQPDLSGITDEDIFISKAIHRADISVDQLGTEATAATAAIGQAESDTSLGVPKVVHVDRPFAFEIVELATGTPLFVGSVADPRAS